MSSSSPVEVPQPAPSPARRRLGRWTKIFIALVIFIVILIVAVQIILITAVPKSLVISTVEEKFGLSLSAQSVTTGWFGHTTLRDVQVSLPLAPAAFVQIPEMEVTHTWLPLLVIFQDVDIKRVDLEHPTLTVVQGPGGQWNLQDVARLLARVSGSNNAAEKEKENKIPSLPSLKIVDATINIRDNIGRSTSIAPVNVTGEPRSAVAWKYDLSIASQVTVQGELAPGGDWAHRVNFNVQNVGGWVKPWASSWPDAANIKGSWKAALVSGHIDGRLLVESLQFGNFSAAGPVEIKAETAGTGIYPQGLQLGINGKENLDTSLVGGSLLLNSDGVQSRTMVAAVAGGHFNIDGKYQWADQSATMAIAWNGVQVPSNMTQSGTLSVSLSSPYSWQKTINATLVSHAELAQGKWDATFNVKGQGPMWSQIAWTVTAPDVEADNGGHAVELHDLTANLATQRGSKGNKLILQSLSNDSDMISGHGEFDLNTMRDWWLTVDGRGWPVPRHINQTMDVDLDLWGSKQLIHLKQMYVRTGQLESWSFGQYVFSNPEPVDAEVYVYQAPSETAVVINGQSVAATQPVDTTRDIVQGSLSGDAHLLGRLLPMDLTFTGDLWGQDLVIDNRRLGNLNVTTHGSFKQRPDKRIVVLVATSQLSIYGGEWTLTGFYPTAGVTSHTFELDVEGVNADLTQLTQNPHIQGQLSGGWKFDITEPNINGVSVTSHMAASNVKLFTGSGNTAVQRAAIESIAVPSLTLFQDTVRVDGIRLVEPVDPSFGVAGSAVASASLSVTDPTQIDLTVVTGKNGWIVDPNFGGVAARVDLAAQHLQIDAAHKAARGKIALDAVINWRKPALATIKTTLDMQGRIAEVKDLGVSTFGGTAKGGAVVDLDHLYKSIADIEWSGIKSDKIADLFPRTHRLSGSFGGSLRIEPAIDRYALEPESVYFQVTPEKGSFGAVALTGININAYLGPERFVLDGRPDRASTISLGGGAVTVWARISKHVDDIMQSQADITFKNVDIDQILRTISPKSAAHQGILDGYCSVLLQPARWREMTAAGKIQLRDSNLADFGPIAFLYSAMHLLQNMSTPTGQGGVEFQLEREMLTIVRARYFNKGAEIRASGTIGNIFAMPDSPINVTGVGSANPFSALKLPVIADVNAVVNVVQNGLITEQITGTARQPVYSTLPFADVTEGFKEFITGDVRQEVRGSAD